MGETGKTFQMRCVIDFIWNEKKAFDPEVLFLTLKATRIYWYVKHQNKREHKREWKWNRDLNSQKVAFFEMESNHRESDESSIACTIKQQILI